MKIPAAVLSAVLLAATTDGYSPSFLPRNLGSSSFVSRSPYTAPPKATASLTMFTEASGGMEQLQEYLDTLQKTSGASKSLPPPKALKLASLATVPVSAALGFVSVPSRRFAAHAVGAVATGIAGAVGKSRLDDWLESSTAPIRMAQALLDHGLTQAAQTAIQATIAEHKLNPEDATHVATTLYANYLVGMVRFDPNARTTELKELAQLRNILSLDDNIHVGQAHAMAAKEWYRLTTLQTSEEELEDLQHPDRLALHKLLFLTERALRQGNETKEAFKFEMARVASALHVSYSEAMEGVAMTVEPFYQKALLTTRTKLGSVPPDTLQKARNTLGISDATAFELHVAAFNAEIRETLGLGAKNEDDEDEDDVDDEDDIDRSNVKFSDAAIERVRDCCDDPVGAPILTCSFWLFPVARLARTPRTL